MTCNCAVAVREGNDVLGIYSCDRPVTAIRYLRDPETPDGKADITRLSDREYKVRPYVLQFMIALRCLIMPVYGRFRKQQAAVMKWYSNIEAVYFQLPVSNLILFYFSGM